MAKTVLRSGLHMLEEDLTEAIRDLCKSFRLERSHTLRSTGSPPGFPDEVIGQPGRSLVLFREVKTTTGRLSDKQRMWLAILHGAGFNVGVWRPIHLLNGTIQREMREITRSAPTGLTRWEEVA